MSEEIRANQRVPQKDSIEQQPEVCFGPDCAQVIFRPGIGLEVIVRKTCSIEMKETAKQAAQELLNGKVKMRYTIEE